eukprot:scpid24770/ scgid25212/ 
MKRPEVMARRRLYVLHLTIILSAWSGVALASDLDRNADSDPFDAAALNELFKTVASVGDADELDNGARSADGRSSQSMLANAFNSLMEDMQHGGDSEFLQAADMNAAKGPKQKSQKSADDYVDLFKKFGVPERNTASTEDESQLDGTQSAESDGMGAIFTDLLNSMTTHGLGQRRSSSSAVDGNALLGDAITNLLRSASEALKELAQASDDDVTANDSAQDLVGGVDTVSDEEEYYEDGVSDEESSTEQKPARPLWLPPDSRIITKPLDTDVAGYELADANQGEQANALTLQDETYASEIDSESDTRSTKLDAAYGEALASEGIEDRDDKYADQAERSAKSRRKHKAKKSKTKMLRRLLDEQRQQLQDELTRPYSQPLQTESSLGDATGASNSEESHPAYISRQYEERAEGAVNERNAALNRVLGPVKWLVKPKRKRTLRIRVRPRDSDNDDSQVTDEHDLDSLSNAYRDNFDTRQPGFPGSIFKSAARTARMKAAANNGVSKSIIDYPYGNPWISRGKRSPPETNRAEVRGNIETTHHGEYYLTDFDNVANQQLRRRSTHYSRPSSGKGHGLRNNRRPRHRIPILDTVLQLARNTIDSEIDHWKRQLGPTSMPEVFTAFKELLHNLLNTVVPHKRDASLSSAAQALAGQAMDNFVDSLMLRLPRRLRQQSIVRDVTLNLKAILRQAIKTQPSSRDLAVAMPVLRYLNHVASMQGAVGMARRSPLLNGPLLKTLLPSLVDAVSKLPFIRDNPMIKMFLPTLKQFVLNTVSGRSKKITGRSAGLLPPGLIKSLLPGLLDAFSNLPFIKNKPMVNLFRPIIEKYLLKAASGKGLWQTRGVGSSSSTGRPVWSRYTTPGAQRYLTLTTNYLLGVLRQTPGVRSNLFLQRYIDVMRQTLNDAIFNTSQSTPASELRRSRIGTFGKVSSPVRSYDPFKYRRSRRKRPGHVRRSPGRPWVQRKLIDICCKREFMERMGPCVSPRAPPDHAQNMLKGANHLANITHDLLSFMARTQTVGRLWLGEKAKQLCCSPHLGMVLTTEDCRKRAATRG